MTMIGFACKGDHAEFITDSLSYNKNVRHLLPCTKFAFLSHLNAVVLGQGTSAFLVMAKTVFMSALESVRTFDDLIREAPGLLREMRDMDGDDFDAANVELSVIVALIGYSETAGEFVSYTFDNHEDFEPRRIEGLFLTPAPIEARPRPHELAEFMRNHYVEDIEALIDSRRNGNETEEQVESVRKHVQEVNEMAVSTRDKWASLPELDVPDTGEDWLTLALYARQSRALSDIAGKVMVGGDLVYGRLDQHTTYTRRIPLFDDTGDEFASMVAGTDHPLAQKAPCGCDSGKPANECCLPTFADEPCSCLRPGATFGECCYVPPERQVATR